MTFVKLDFTQGKAEQRLQGIKLLEAFFFFWMINDRDFFIIFDMVVEEKYYIFSRFAVNKGQLWQLNI